MANFRQWAFIGVPVIVLGGLVFWRVGATKADEAKQKAEAGARRGSAQSVEASTAQPKTIIESFEAVGTVVSQQIVNLAPRISGQVRFLEVREGDQVTAGQVLARIDPRQAAAGVLEGQARVSESRSRLAQAEATVRSTEIQVEQAIREAKASVATAEAQLQQTRKDSDSRVAAAESKTATSRSAQVQAEASKKNAEAEYRASLAQLKNEQIRLQRIKSQYEKGYISAQDVDDAIAKVESAEADTAVKKGELDSAEAQIKAAAASLAADEKTLSNIRESAKAEQAAAKARIDQAKAGLSSSLAERSQNPANRANISALRSGVAIQEAQLRAASAEQDDTVLRSPINGAVTMRAADPGSLASPGQALLRIESTNSLFVNATAPIDRLGQIAPGQKAVMNLTEGQQIVGTVDKVVPSANASDRQALIRIRIPGSGSGLRPGMFVRAAIELKRREAKVAVPKDAVKEDSVFVIGEDMTVTKREVKTGQSDSQAVEILEGIQPGEKVVALSYSPLKDKGKVSITAERFLDGTRKVIEKPKKPEGGAQGQGSGGRGGGK